MGTASKLEDLKVGASEFSNIVELVTSFQELAKKSEADLATGAGFSAKVKHQLRQWKAQEQPVLEQIDQKRKELLAKGLRLDLAFIKKLAADEAICWSSAPPRSRPSTKSAGKSNCFSRP